MALPAGQRQGFGCDGDSSDLLLETGVDLCAADPEAYTNVRELFGIAALGPHRLPPKWKRILSAAGLAAGALLAVTLCGPNTRQGLLQLLPAALKGRQVLSAYVVQQGPWEAPKLGPTANFSEGMISWSVGKETSLCLDVRLGIAETGTPVQAWPCYYLNANQQFVYPKKLGMIRWAISPSKCLAVDTGKYDFVHIADCLENHTTMQFLMPDDGMGPVRWAKHPDKCFKMDTRVLSHYDGLKHHNVTEKEFNDGELVKLEANKIEIGDCPQQTNAKVGHVGALTPPSMIWMVNGLVNKYDWAKQAGGLNGQYGYLSEFWISSIDQEYRITQMKDQFGIKEFQFYMAFQGFSHPPAAGAASWDCAMEKRRVLRHVVQNGTKFIREKFGGRSWLYLSAQSVDPGDDHMTDGFHKIDQKAVNQQVEHKFFEVFSAGAEVSTESMTYERQCGCQIAGHILKGGNSTMPTLMSMVHMNSAWAVRIVEQWAQFANSLGFDGIHWDTEGALGAPLDHAAHTDIPGFLRTAVPYLQKWNVTQTLNFVDGYGWDSSLLYQPRHIAFKYWELWSLPSVEQHFWETVEYDKTAGTGFVFAAYPGWTAAHCCMFNERQNAAQFGIWPIDLGIKRWQRAHAKQGSYLFIGDGLRHLQGPFLPDSTFLCDFDVNKIEDKLKESWAWS